MADQNTPRIDEQLTELYEILQDIDQDILDNKAALEGEN